ncbi:MAG: hypothetical protein LRZ88_04765 [Candidatus Cloacimonetes bacterium]|nr:hypothetical protein [Candidatus Cloacimonadota bacterium]
MKSQKLLLLTTLMLALCAIVFAQSTTIDFEPAGSGADWAWTVGENGANPPLTFPANPVSGGINASATVAQFTATAGGNPWALCFTDDIDTFSFTAANSLVKIMVYKPVISNVAIKFEGGSTPLELAQANSVINQWEELTFDFSSVIGNTYSRIVIIPDFAPRTQDNILYFDNIQIPEGNVAPPTVPEVAAPTPTYDAGNVISLFSNAYTNVPVDTWSAGWDMLMWQISRSKAMIQKDTLTSLLPALSLPPIPLMPAICPISTWTSGLLIPQHSRPHSGLNW